MDRHCSILVPSRGPVELLAGMLASLQACTAEPDTVELLLRVDDDDPDLQARMDAIEGSGLAVPTQVFIGQRCGLGQMTVELAGAAIGRSVWLLNDDVIHGTYGWDRLVREVVNQRPDHAFFPDDCLFSPELACFPLLPKAHIDATGFYGIGQYERYLIDSIISDIYSFTLDRLVFLPQWMVRHLNAQPTASVNGARFYRTARADASLAYQPADEETLERDKSRYVRHVRTVGAIAGRIREAERAA